MLWETKESKAAGEVQALQMLQVSEEKKCQPTATEFIQLNF